MKRLLVLALLFVPSACALYAQAASTTVCEVLKNPKAFDGKMVTITGTVVAGLDHFVIDDGDCGKDINGIWLAYPHGSKAKSGPAVMLEITPAHNFSGTMAMVKREPVTLNKDKNFKLFDSALARVYTSPGICLGCVKNEVRATVTGRLDGVEDAALKHDPQGKITGLGGFGDMNAYPARLVIASVADVTPKEIDYLALAAPARPAVQSGSGQPMSAAGSKSPTSSNNGSQVTIQNMANGATPTGPGQGPGPGQDQGTVPESYADQLTTLQKTGAAMAASTITTQIQKDIAALPKPKEHGGTVITYGTMNEVSADEGAAGTADAPDGVIYSCTFNHDRLPDAAARMALMHMAQHIADLRALATGNQEAPLLVLEHNAWLVTATLAAVGGEKMLMLPGGYLIWNAGWPDAEKTNDLQSALNGFLTKVEGLSQ